MTKSKTSEPRKRAYRPPNPGKAPPTTVDKIAVTGKVEAQPAKAAAKPTGKPVAKGKPEKAISAVAFMRAHLARDPEASVEAIAAALAKAGLNKPADTVRTIRSDFQGTYRALAKAGQLKSPVVLA